MVTEIKTYENDAAYEDGYEDACEVTNDLLGTLMEDVQNYHAAYLHILKQYTEHMAACSRVRPSPTGTDMLPGFAAENPRQPGSTGGEGGAP